MYKILHFISEDSILKEYRDWMDLESSYKDYVDGIEIIRCGCEDSHYIKDHMIIGVHLPFYTDWLSFWKSNRKILEREFQSSEVWESYYGGEKPEVLIPYFQKDMDYAQKVGTKYVVFHVSNVSIWETFTRNFDYTDEEVIEATIELVNQLFEGKDYNFEFLLENLSWPGLNFTSGKMAKKLLKGINYKKTGFILDTGHMMQNNLEIGSPKEGIDYICSWFEKNSELIPFIRGMHIHQSLSGDYIKKSLKEEPKLERDFYGRFAQAYEYVFKIDQHQVLEADNIGKLLTLIEPEYLVYEFRSSNRGDREKKLLKQDKYINFG